MPVVGFCVGIFRTHISLSTSIRRCIRGYRFEHMQRPRAGRNLSRTKAHFKFKSSTPHYLHPDQDEGEDEM
jgi:hypothetical protein